MKKNKIVLIGCGMVGMSFAYASVIKGIADELVLIDYDSYKASGEVMDLQDGLLFTNKFVNIKVSDYSDIDDASLIVITAGRAQLDGETRIDLLNKNLEIIKKISDNINETNYNGNVLIASNPVDIITYYAKKYLNIDDNKIIGSGTTLDSSRLRFELSRSLNIHPKHMHAYILGEHGDTSFACYSLANYSSISVTCEKYSFLSNTELVKIEQDIKNKAYEIIKRKKYTNYAIGLSLCEISKALLSEMSSTLPLSTMCNYYGINDVCLSLPCVVSNKGIEFVIELNLSENEIVKLNKSADALKDVIKNIK